jgi:hypothetical protein
MHAICAYLSSAVGLVAAGLWFWASRIEVPTNLSTLFDHDMIAGLGPMRAGFARVASFNRWAASATALAVFLQALAQAFSP